MSSISLRPWRPIAWLMATSSSANLAGAPQGGGRPLAARLVAHGRHHLVERPFQIDGGRAGGDQRGIGALQRLVGGIVAQRQPHAVGRGGADQRRAAHLHGLDGPRGVFQRRKLRDDEAMRQLRLVDDADALAVAFQPDAAGVFAVDFHGAEIAVFFRCRPREGGARRRAYRSAGYGPGPRFARCMSPCLPPRPAAMCACGSGEWPSTTKRNTTTAAACPSIRRFSSAGRATRPPIARPRPAPSWGSYGPSPRQTIDLFPAKDDGATTPLAVHPWRLVALARAVDVHPCGGRAERQGRHRGGRRLRALPAGDDRQHHRADARGLPLSLAQASSASWWPAIPPAGILPPAWWRRNGRRLPPTRRPTWCRAPMRFPACSISRRSCTCR